VTRSLKVEAELRRTRESFDLAVRGSSDGLWDWPDIARDERWWSPRFYELLGYADREIVLTYSGFLELMPPEDKDRVIAAMAAHPILIERPVVFANGKAALGRPPEAVLDIL